MAVSGGPVGDRIAHLEMATAIVRSHTPDGFIIAADGRELEGPGRVIISDQRQKIFQVGTEPIAYCATGHTLLGDRREAKLETVLFDFNIQLAKHSQGVSASDFDRMEEVARKVCWPIYDELLLACGGGNVDFSNTLGGPGRGEAIVAVFFDGYLRGGIPDGATVRFFHEDGVPGEPEVLSDGTGVFRYGSELVESEMVSGSTFDKYKKPLPQMASQYSKNLNRMIHAAVSYISACSSPEAHALDPDKCLGIGGRIHVARITPNIGFRWVRGYEPVTSSPTASSPPSTSLG